MARENAGYRIITAVEIPTHPEDPKTELVLGKNSSGNYVSWVCFGVTHYEWGDYYGSDLKSAFMGFVDRVKEYTERLANRTIMELKGDSAE